jgi:hypothetical protein
VQHHGLQGSHHCACWAYADEGVVPVEQVLDLKRRQRLRRWMRWCDGRCLRSAAFAKRLVVIRQLHAGEGRLSAMRRHEEREERGRGRTMRRGGRTKVAVDLATVWRGHQLTSALHRRPHTPAAIVHNSPLALWGLS